MLSIPVSKTSQAGPSVVQTFTFAGCWVHVDREALFLQTVFRDGTSLQSIPVPEKDRKTARLYGYGSDWLSLWCEHDLLHHWIAQRFGLPYSPTLWAECHPGHAAAIPAWARRQEEDFIAHVHRWLNLGVWVPDLWPLQGCNESLDSLRQNALRFFGEVRRNELTDARYGLTPMQEPSRISDPLQEAIGPSRRRP